MDMQEEKRRDNRASSPPFLLFVRVTVNSMHLHLRHTYRIEEKWPRSIDEPDAS